MARRATRIAEVRASAQNPVLVLDAGNTLLGETLSLQTEGRVIVEAMNAMGYDAMAVGQMDLAKGVPALLARAGEARFAVLSANLARKSDGELLLRAYAIIERNGVRIGVLGLTEPEAVEAPGAGELVHLLDPVTTAERLVPELRAQSDVVIVLSHLGLERDRQVARAVEGIDVIVGGVDGILPGEAQYQGRTLLVQAGYDGEWLGRVDLPLDGEAAGVDARATAVEMGPDVPDDPALAEIVAHWRALDPGVAAPSR